MSLFRAIEVLGRPTKVAPVALGAIFGGGSPEPAKPPPVVPMPDYNDPAIALSQRRRLEMAAARSGRASTVLSGNDSEYSGNKLGVA